MRKKFKKNIIYYTIASIFIIMVLALGSIYAIGSNEMSITGQAYFVAQLSKDKLPVFPIPNEDNPDEYFTPNISNNQQIYVIEQNYIDGDFYLSICSSNSNNGNAFFSIDFHLMNPTAYTWTNGIANHDVYPIIDGGLSIQNFTFTSATITPATLITNQIATITLNMQAQLGRANTQGSRIIIISYEVLGNNLNTKIYFNYYARDNEVCPL